MNEFKEIYLGFEAIEYINDCLKNGNTLAQQLLQSFDIKKGEIVTYLPSYIQENAVKEFYYGGKLLGLKDYSESSIKANDYPTTFLLSLIEKQLQSGDNSICIIENAIAKPQDQCLSLLNVKPKIYNDEVYHIFSAEDVVRDKIKNDFMQIKSVPTFIGATIVLPINVIKSFKLKRELNFEDFKTITSGIEKMFVGAYDGESYIIWSKN